MWSTNEVEKRLHQEGPLPPLLLSLILLYKLERELFCQLAVVGVTASAPRWMREAAATAALLRALARSFDITGNADEGTITSDYDPAVTLNFRGVSQGAAREFMRSLAGFPTAAYDPPEPGDRMRGHSVTEAQVVFQLGERKEDAAFEKLRDVYYARRQGLGTQ